MDLPSVVDPLATDRQHLTGKDDEIRALLAGGG
jgi:hypothetical protein